MSEAPSKTVQDWNIQTAAAFRILGELRRRQDISLTPEEDAALGAGRLALHLMLPGERQRVTDEMVQNAMLGCPGSVRDAMGVNQPAEQTLAWMLERAMATLVAKFNKYRPDPAARRRRS